MLLRVQDTGTVRACNPDEVRKALAVLADPAAGVQLQAAPYWGYRTFHGTDLDGMAAWVDAQETRSPTGIYYGLNPVPATLADRTKIGDVLSRRWLPIDVDRAKTEETLHLSATYEEKVAAQDMANDVSEFLEMAGWPQPLIVDSGNGWHLLYRIDLANDPLGRVLVKSVLHALAEKFNGDRGMIGAECHDARRIFKLPGTWARKGPDTPDRPHRMARLHYVPPEMNVVTFEQLQQMGKPPNNEDAAAPIQEPAKLPPLAPGILRLRVAGTPDKQYARAALEAECRKMAMAKPGELNAQLFRSGAALGNLVGSELLTEQEVFDRVLKAGQDAGCDNPRKDADTLIRAIREGTTTPRKPPERNGTHTPGAAPADGTKPLTICASAIRPQKVEWLWPGRIPKRFITVLAGRTGLGKSFVTLDMVARMTTGNEVPFGRGECFARGGALIISEDPPEYMLTPRLMEMGADLDMVRFMSWEAMAGYSIADVEYLDRAYAEVPECRVVVIDPPTNFLGDTDEHRNAEVRQMLMRLVLWVKERDVATVLIMHVNKQTGKGVEAVNRVLGSVAWVSTSRIAHSFTPDPSSPGRCLFVPMKNNLGSLPLGLAYEIVPTDTLAKVDWIGEVDTTADEAMNSEPKRVRRDLAAKEWLVEQFKLKLEWPSDELFAAARQAGMSRNAVFEAKKLLPMPSARKVTNVDGSQTWVWWVPPDWGLLSQSTTEDRDSRDSGTVEPQMDARA